MKGKNCDPDNIWKFIKFETTGKKCWTWIGTLSNRGYGEIWFNGKHYQAHRFVYELFIGKIPDGLVLDHFECQKPNCVNPEHLEPVPQKENLKRGDHNNQYKGKSYCSNDHEFTKENTWNRKRGKIIERVCKQCDKNRHILMRKKMEVMITR